MTLNELFKNTTYDDTLFSDEAKSAVSARIFMKAIRGNEVPYITCAIRDKEIKLTPEESVRQLYIYQLMNEYGYAASRIQLETPIHFGREVKRADIAIMDKDRPMVPYIIVELKKPKLTDGKEQLKSYCNATGAPIGVWTNGEQISCYNRKDPNFFEEISDIPKATQKLSDIINEKFTYEDLKRKDKISTQKKSLRSLIKEMEDEVLASAGVDSFEEIFKLIFVKLYDELICANDPTAYLQFRNNGNTDYELKEKIQGLFDDAKKKWEGIFTDESKILLSPSHLAVCVASLQDIKLFNNNLDVVDDAFEYLMSKAQKGEKGQYFTPRYVIDMCVKMMNPTTQDKIIDTACGSSGFTVHSIFKVWKDIRREKGLPEDDGFTAAERIPEETNFVRDNVFAIDFDEKTVRVARTLNLIAGDGQTIIKINSAYEQITGRTKEELINLGWAKITYPDDLDEDIQNFNKLQAGEIKSYSMEKRYVKPDGSVVWVYMVVASLAPLAGNKLNHMCLIQDITNQKAALAALIESETKYRSITENMSDVVWQMDLDLKTTYVSPSVEKLLGESIEEHMNRKMEEKFPAQTLHKIQSIFYEELEKEKDPEIDKNRSLTIEIEHYKADGTVIWLELSISFIRDDNGNAVGFQGSSRDITPRKLFEFALRENERRESILMSHLPGLAYKCKYDHDWTMQYVSKGCYDLTGYKSESLLNIGIGTSKPMR